MAFSELFWIARDEDLICGLLFSPGGGFHTPGEARSCLVYAGGISEVFGAEEAGRKG